MLEENNINEFEIKSSSFYVDGKNSIQLLLLGNLLKKFFNYEN